MRVWIVLALLVLAGCSEDLRATPIDVSLSASDTSVDTDDTSTDTGTSVCELLTQDCPLGACLPAPDGTPRCVAEGPQSAGERCGPGLELCQAGTICVLDSDGTAYVCRTICDPTTGCDDVTTSCVASGVAGLSASGLGTCEPTD